MIQFHLLISVLITYFTLLSANEIFINLYENNEKFTSDIHRVKLYSNNFAEVIHHISLNKILAQGDNTLILSSLPSSLVENSLQFLSTNNLQIQDYKIESKSYTAGDYPYYIERIKKLKEAMRLIEKERYEILSKKAMYEDQLQTLKQFVSSALTSPVTSTSLVKEVKDYFEFMKMQQSETERINKEINFFNTMEREKDDELQPLQKELDLLIGKQKYGNNYYSKENNVIVEPALSIREHNIHIHVKTILQSLSPTIPVSGEIFLRYFLSPASWEPKYEMKIENMKKEEKEKLTTGESFALSLNFYAKVSQNTGMDWEDVELLLSTSSPEDIYALQIPRRRSISYSFQQPMMNYGNKKSSRRYRQVEMAAMAAPMMAKSAPEADGMFEDAPMDQAFVAGGMQVAGSTSFTNSLGNLDSSYIYQVQHKVNLTSPRNPRHLESMIHPDNFYSHLLLMKEYSLPIHIFTYLAPAIETSGYRIAYGKFPENEIPLLSSSNVRIEIEDDFIGTSVDFQGMIANQNFLQNIGKDNFLKISYTNSVPLNSQVEEDRSTWFVKDSVKYKVISEEKSILLKNTHKPTTSTATTDKNNNEKEKFQLFIIVDSIPVTTEEDMKVNLIDPKPEDLNTLSDDTSSDSSRDRNNRDLRKEKSTASSASSQTHHHHHHHSLKDDQHFLENIVQKEYSKKSQNELKIPKNFLSSGSSMISKTVYHSKNSGNLYWAIWIHTDSPNTELLIPLQYKIVRPENKMIYFN